MEQAMDRSVEDDEQGVILLHDLVPTGTRFPGDVFGAQVGDRADVLGHHATWLAARQRYERQAANLRSAGAGHVHGGAMVDFAVLVNAAVRVVQELQVRDHLRAVGG